MDIAQQELAKIKEIRQKMARLYSQLTLDKSFDRLPADLAALDFDVLAEAMNVIDDYEQLVVKDYEGVLGVLSSDLLSDEELSPVAKREAGLIDMLLSSSVLGDK